MSSLFCVGVRCRKQLPNYKVLECQQHSCSEKEHLTGFLCTL